MLAVWVDGGFRPYMHPEPEFLKIKQENKSCLNPIHTLFKGHREDLIRMTLFTACFSVASSIVVVFIPNYLSSELLYDAPTVFKISTTVFLIFTLICPIIGYISDKIGIIKISQSGNLMTAACGIPFVSGIIYSTNPAHTLMLVLAFLIPFSLVSASLFAIMVNAFPTNVRYTAVSFAYSTSAAIFGGFTPLMINRLSQIIPINFAAGSILTLSGLISFFAIYKPYKQTFSPPIQLTA